MAEVDTSIYKDAVAENPLDMAGKVVDYRNKLLGNQRQQIAVQTDQVGLDSAKVELGVKRFGIMNSAISGLMGDPDFGKVDLRKKINDVVGQLVNQSVLTVPHAVEALKGIPDDPAQQATAIRNFYSQTLSAEQKGQAFLGSPQGIRDNAGTQIAQVPGYPGLRVQDRGYVADQYPPGQEKTDNNRLLPNGQPNPNYLTKGTVGPAGPPGIQQGPGVMPPANGAPARAKVPSSAKVVGDDEGENNGLYPSQRVSQGFDAARSRPLVTAPPPGAAETMASQAQEGQKSGSALNSRADAVPQRMADLNNMERDLEIAGGKFGPLAHSEKKANQIAQRVLGFGITMSPEEVAGIENFDKIGNQIALNQAGALGVTDQRVQTSMGANPNSDYSYLGNKGILPILKGNEDAIAVKAREWKKYSKTRGADTYNDFSDEFNQGFNPQAFQFARMTPEQRSKFIASIPDKEQAVQLAKDLDAYKKRGWLKPVGDEAKK